jgi:transposase-like protein
MRMPRHLNPVTSGFATTARNRPVYAVVFIDAINVKIREGQVANRPVYLALGVTVDGEREVLGLRAGEHGDGEGAKYWLRVLSEVKNRGVRDVCLLVCDGLKGLPDAVGAVWEKTIVQTSSVDTGRRRDGPAGHRAVRGGPMQTRAFEARMQTCPSWRRRAA